MSRRFCARLSIAHGLSDLKGTLKQLYVNSMALMQHIEHGRRQLVFIDLIPTYRITYQLSLSLEQHVADLGLSIMHLLALGKVGV